MGTMRKIIGLALALCAGMVLCAAETPRETLDKTKFANKTWDAIPLLLEERKAEKSSGSIDEVDDMLGDEDAVALEEGKTKYDPMVPPKGDWGQCGGIGDRSCDSGCGCSGNKT